MPAPIPRFRAGQTLDQISASTLNRLVEACERIEGLAVGPGLELGSGPAGLALRLSAAAGRAAPRRATVAIVEMPTIESQSLRIQAVRYTSMPPQQCPADCREDGNPPCSYAWAGDPVDAYPDFGWQAIGYAPYVWLEGGPPRLETPFLRAYLDAVWIVEAPPVALRHVVVTAISEPEANYLEVQDVRPRRGADGAWDGTFAAFGPRWLAAVHPESVAGDFSGFVFRPGPGGELGPACPVLLAQRIHGAWWVSQYIRWECPPLPADAIFNDCTVNLRA